MDKELKDSNSAAVPAAANKKRKAGYQKPKLERFGRVVDHTCGFSLPALESGDPQNRHN